MDRVRGIWLAVALAIGCGTSTPPAEPTEPALVAERCRDGARQKCDCRAGKGYQTCEGGSFTPCVCIRPELLGASRGGELARYTRDLTGTGPLRADIVTSLGTISCTLFADRAPLAVTNFVGLARGMKPWRNPETGRLTSEPYYDGTVFHRVERNFIIQGGDPTGTGTGGPGFTYETEQDPSLKHDRPGRLAMARGPELDTNGGQFYITLNAFPYLDSPGAHYTVFGQCSNLSLIRRIANAPAVRSRPVDPVTIRTIRIRR